MRALVASPASEEHVELREVPEPSPGSHETVVSVRSISLNRGEVNRLAHAEDGARLGWDIAGTVARPSADGSGLPEGTRVAAFVLGGGWAERVAVPNLSLAALPDGVSFSAASAVPVAGLTALRMLRLAGFVLDKNVLVTGAAGGVGRYLIQLAARSGALVTAVVGSHRRGAGLRELGAREVVTDLESLGPHDVIFESVGGASLATAFRLVAPQGTVVTFGNSSRETTTFDVSVFYGKQARIHGFSLLAPSQPQDFRADLSLLLDLLARGELDSQIDVEESWSNAPSVLAALRTRQVHGKAVLRVD